MLDNRLNSVFRQVKPYPTKSISDEIKNTPGMLNLSIGEPCHATPASIIQAAIDAVAMPSAPQGKGGLLQGRYTHYEHSQGAIGLRAAIAEKYRREHGLALDPDTQILVTNGGIEAVFLALFSVLDPGDEVVIPDPSYAAYEPMVSLHRGVPIRVPTTEGTNFRLDPDLLRRIITHKTKAIILNSPSNPTGTVYDEQLLRQIMDIASKRSVFVLHDEVHEKIVYSGNSHCPMAKFDRGQGLVVMINSCSKTYAMTGWRLGWMTAASELLEIAQRAHSYMSLSINTFVQQAGIKALSSPEIEEEVQRMVKGYEKGRDFFVDALNKLPGVECSQPQGTFYAFPNIGEFYGQNRKRIEATLEAELDRRLWRTKNSEPGIGVEEVEQLRSKLEEDLNRTLSSPSMAVARFFVSKAKVGCVPGVVFGEHGENHIRFSFGFDMHYLQEAVARLTTCAEEVDR